MNKDTTLIATAITVGLATLACNFTPAVTLALGLVSLTAALCAIQRATGRNQ